MDYELEGVAIVGLAGRFPGAENIKQFWQNLADGNESLTTLTDEEMLKAGVNPELLTHPDYVKLAPIIEDADTFDAAFFGFSPREAEIMDPQHRIFLECAWEALEDAGYSQEAKNRNIGLYAGVGFNGYFLANVADYFKSANFTQILQYLVGNDKDYLATHTSYKLNLSGPSMVVQTACSSSLVAVAQACQSLLNYQCDMALAGGVTVRVPRRTGYLYEEGSVCARDGHCRPFDAQASGTVYGDGVGIVVLKRLDEAVADRDQIYAVIKGFGVNNDGKAKVSYTAPSVEGQAAAIAMAQAMANITPDTITLIEAHGTGTLLGDPIEIAALRQTFASATDKKEFCAIGSVKSNVGHLDGAAGVTSLIKTILALKHKQIPATLNFTQPNPQIDFANSPFYVNTKLKNWTTDSMPRRAGVSSFGFGGTNAHIVLEEAPQRQLQVNISSNSRHILTLSAKTPSALQQLAKHYYDFLQEKPPIALADICFTANTGRTHFKYRLAICGTCIEDFLEKLTLFMQQDSVSAQIQLTRETDQEAELAARYMQGEEIDWFAVYKTNSCYRVTLPTYPFERQRYWLEPLNAKITPVIQQQTIQDNVYETQWLPQVLFIQPVKENLTWLIFADNKGIAAGLQNYFNQQEVNSILIKPGKAWHIQSAKEWTINALHKEDYRHIESELAKQSALRCGVIYLWGLDANSELTANNDLLTEQAILCGSVVNILQVLEKFIKKLWLITSGAVAIADKNNLLAVNQTPLLGLSKTIALEYQDKWSGLIDLDLNATNQKNVEYLSQEIFSDGQSEYIAYRDEQRYVARLSVWPAQQKTTLLFEPSATYLITGGLGGLGLQLAGWLVEQGAKYLVVVGRQAASFTQQEAVQQLRVKGCTVEVIQADVARRDDVVMLLEKISVSLPPLTGVFHLAGILDLATIQQLDWQAAEQVLAPKLAGSWNLHQLTRNLPLKMFVMFSSIAASLGAPATASYACANAFLDGLANYRKGLGLPALSINWGAWTGAGMADRLSVNHHQPSNNFGFISLTLEKGFQRLRQLLQANMPQVSVMTVDWVLWSQSMNVQQAFLEQVLPRVDSLDEKSPKPELEELFHLPVFQRKTRLLHFIQQLVAKILRMPADTLPDIHGKFTEIGMDSLMAIELRNQLQIAIGKKLSATLMFNNSTIAALAEYLLTHVFEAPFVSNLDSTIIIHAKPSSPAIVDEAVIKNLSENELLQKIAEEYQENLVESK